MKRKGLRNSARMFLAPCLALVVTFLATSIAFPQTAAQYKLSLGSANSLMSNKEQFEFTLDGSQRIIFDSANMVVSFSKLFAPGQSYRITQTSGPRTCTFVDKAAGTFVNADISVTVNCGYPPLTLMKLQVTGIETGETFSFADNYRRTHSLSFPATVNLGGFPRGDDYSVTQKSGPRPCKMTFDQGVVSNTPLTIGADCRKISVETPGPTRAFPEIELVSRSTDDKTFGTFYSASAPVIGGMGADEGRYIAFVSDAAGLGGSKGKYRQIFWRDRVTGETRMISASAVGGEGNGNSFAPAISADGLSVAFESYATNLVPIDTNNVRDIFVWNAKTNTVTAVSTGPGEIETNSESFEPVISGDGSRIAFSSGASNLAPGVTGTDTINVYLKKVGSGIGPVLISMDPKTKKGVGGSRPSISDDGSRVAFYSFASTLVPDDKNGMWDIFLYDSRDQKLKRLTTTATGGERDQGTESISRVVAPAISGDGNFVAYSTTAANVVPGDNNKMQDVFVVNVASGEVKRISTGTSGVEGNGDSPAEQGEKVGISFDGRHVAYSTVATNLGGNILLKDLTTGEVTVISADVTSRVSRPSVSRSGAYVIFGSGSRLDGRFASSGIFAKFTRCRSCSK